MSERLGSKPPGAAPDGTEESAGRSEPSAMPGHHLGGALATAAAVVLQGGWLAHRYPSAYLDADLLSYLSYYRDWHAGLATRFGYTVPKVLPFALFGPLGSPEAAAVLSLLTAAVGGALVFVLAARSFGTTAAVLAGLAYVFDPLRSILTLRSSADLYVGVGLLAAMYALTRRAVLLAGVAILVAALAKPVAAVCGLAALVVPGVPRWRRLAGATLGALALPAVAALDAALDGRPALAGAFHMGLPDEHHAFVRVAQGPPLHWLESLHMLFVDWFGKLLFARTWPLVLIGVGLYAVHSFTARRSTEAVADRADTRLVLLTVPLLLGGAYVVLAAVQPFVFFTRFFWILAVALTILAAYGAAAVAARAPVPVAGRIVLAAVFALALVADRWDDFQWRKQFALDPFESHALLADRGVELIADEDVCAGDVVVPLAYLPLAAWRAPGKLREGALCATEDWAAGRGCAQPTCVLVMPAAPTTPLAREASVRLLGPGWAALVSDEHGALVRAQGRYDTRRHGRAETVDPVAAAHPAGASRRERTGA